MKGQCRTGYTDPLCPWRTRAQIRDEVLAFVNAGEGKPEFIGWCSAYDHAALCQLFGTMMGLPSGWPHYTKDIQYVLDERGILDSQLPPVEGQAHNALADARQIKQIWEFVHKPMIDIAYRHFSDEYPVKGD